MEKILSPQRSGKDHAVDRRRLDKRVDEVLRTEAERTPSSWSGDHAFSAEAAKYSLENFLEPEVARKHPDWSPSEVSGYALHEFQKRLTQDLSSEQREVSHEDSLVVWEKVETDGGWELATRYGDSYITLNDLWEHTKAYARDSGNLSAYNEAEHRAQIRMQEELIGGTSRGFVSVTSHPEAIRYVQVWETTEEGSVTSKNVDLFAATGRDLLYGEAEQLIGRLQDFHGEDRTRAAGQDTSAHAHFFVSEGRITAQDVATMAIAQTVLSEKRHDQEVSYREPPASVRAIRDAFGEPGETMRSFHEYLTTYIEERRQQLRSLVFEEPSANTLQKRGKPEHRTEQRTRPPKQSGERYRKPIDGKPVDIVTFTLADWAITKTIISHIPVVPVASPAALFWFSAIDRLGYDLLKSSPVRESKRVGRAGIELPAGTKRKKEDMWQKLIGMLTVPHRSDIRGKPFLHMHMAEWMKLLISTETPRMQKKESRRPELSLPAEQNVWTMTLQALAVCFRSAEQKTNDTPFPYAAYGSAETKRIAATVRELISDEKLLPVGKLLFTWIMWRALSEMPSPPKNAPRTPAGWSQERRPGEQEEGALLPEAGTPWMLLAIIWYLAQLREMALVTPQPVIAAVRIRPKRKRKRSLPFLSTSYFSTYHGRMNLYG